MEHFIAEIILFAGNFAPRGWKFCHGQLLSVSANQALFSLLGATYGGDGRTTFALPDLRGRTPIGVGRGPGLTPRNLGNRSGREEVVLTEQQIATHTHDTGNLSVEIKANSSKGSTAKPGDNFLAQSVKPESRGKTEPINTYSDSEDGTSIKGGTVHGPVSNAGGNLPHNNMQPFLAINYIICVQGVYPSRN